MIRKSASEPTDLIINRLERTGSEILLSSLTKKEPTWLPGPPAGPKLSLSEQLVKEYVETSPLVSTFIPKIDPDLLSVGNETALKERIAELVSEVFMNSSLSAERRRNLEFYIFLKIRQDDVQPFINELMKVVPNFLPKIDLALFSPGNESNLKAKIGELVAAWASEEKVPLGSSIREKLVIHLLREFLREKGRDVRGEA